MAEDRLSMSLDDIIAKKEGGGRGGRGRPNTNRTARASTGPYSGGGTRRAPVKKANDGELDIKFLSSNFLAGMLIGKGGEKIKKFMALTRANITVSGPDDHYPGTNSRYITIKGSIDAVSQAVSVIWEMVALAASDDADAKGNWIPTSSMTHSFDATEVEGRLVVPAASVGKVIGKDMVTIKSMVDSTGATVHFAKRYEPSLPGHSDRIVIVSGEVLACAEVSSLILDRVKLFLDHRVPSQESGQHEQDARYAPADGTKSRVRSAQRKAKVGRGQARTYVSGGETVAEVLEASTTVSMAVPNDLIGNIIGMKGATLKQIQEATSAAISISNWGEYVAGTENSRLVTVTGDPECVSRAIGRINRLLK